MATKILIVDDEQPISRLLMYQLHELGYQVSQASDGFQALQRFQRERPDLVLLDVMMPGMSGWDVCRQIRTVSQVPIIMLTAKSAEVDVVSGLEAGADDYIAKPFKMPQLQARIEAVMRRAKERTAARPALERTAMPERSVPLDPPAPAQAAAAVSGAAAGPPQPTPTLTPDLSGAAESARLGPRLRSARLARGISLNEASTACKVRWDFLQAIEQENFSYVPRAQLRLALHTYANFLGLNLRELVRQPPRQRQKTPILNYAAVVAIIALALTLTLWLMR
jgi:CheY-like chemotaxis protein